MEDVDVLISLVPVLVDQKPLFLAAKRAGVGRVVPSDFGSTAPKGVSTMHDAVCHRHSPSFQGLLMTQGVEIRNSGLHQRAWARVYLHRGRDMAVCHVTPSARGERHAPDTQEPSCVYDTTHDLLNDIHHRTDGTTYHRRSANAESDCRCT